MDKLVTGQLIAQKTAVVEIVAIKAHKGGKFSEVARFSESEKSNNQMRRGADILQQQFDEDCDPVRVYCLLDGVPVYAALSSKDNMARILNMSDGGHYPGRLYWAINGCDLGRADTNTAFGMPVPEDAAAV